MMRTLVGTAAIALMVGIGACATPESEVGQAETSDGAGTEEPSNSEVATTDSLYLEALKDGGVPQVDDVEDEIISYGHAVCDDLDNGHTPMDIAMSSNDDKPDSWDEEDVGYTVGTAIQAYCPEHTDQVEDMGGEQ